MDWMIDMGIAALLRVLQNKRDIQKWARAIAKVYVSIERTAELSPDLTAAIEKKRAES